jgi:hypothetical protein
MKFGRIFALAILAGLIAGGILAGISMAIVLPYTSILVDMRLEEMIAEGEFDEEFALQSQSIYASQAAGSIALGLAGGALVGGVYAFGKIGTSPLKAAVMIAGVAWFVLYVVPAVKYPPGPQAVFDSQLAGQYQLLIGYTAVSGLSALGIAVGFRRIKRKDKALGAAALYMAVIAAAFFAFPSYQEDDSFYSKQVIDAWRAGITGAMTVFWFALGVTAGLLWQYGQPRQLQ